MTKLFWLLNGKAGLLRGATTSSPFLVKFFLMPVFVLPLLVPVVVSPFSPVPVVSLPVLSTTIIVLPPSVLV